MISLIAGAEYDFRPKEKVNPFVSLELAANFFSGKIEASGDTTIHITRKSETRFGVNANAGIDVKINKGISLLFGAKYCMDNLFGKSYETVTTTTANKDTNPTSGGTTVYELPLNDGDHGSLQSLSIIHVQIYAGISFNIGSVKEKGNSK
jgi:opacity protein-like surface antigen